MEAFMLAVKISPKYQVVIPRTVRKSLHLRPGQKVQVVEYGNRIELVPVFPFSRLRGFVKGIDTTVERMDDRV
jgi:AbrB family looped-hinge helix DNA binding protein